ncbi:MAG: TIGR00725 family protein [Bacillota bacterium]|nr:TIGR00725 family protein [Bacillota bacterium]
MVYVTVVGGALCSKEEREMARQVGSEVARRGGVVICGGGSGVMEAAAEGAAQAGGIVIGILPGSSTLEGNPHLSFAVATGLGEARNAVIARTADAMIAVGGEFGTLSEIALALKMGKPVVGLKSWSIKSPRGFDHSIVQAATSLEAVENIYKKR